MLQIRGYTHVPRTPAYAKDYLCLAGNPSRLCISRHRRHSDIVPKKFLNTFPPPRLSLFMRTWETLDRGRPRQLDDAIAIAALWKCCPRYSFYAILSGKYWLNLYTRHQRVKRNDEGGCDDPRTIFSATFFPQIAPSPGTRAVLGPAS